MYILFLNGPPGSGKDTVAGFLKESVYAAGRAPVSVWHLASPLRKAAMTLAGLVDTDANYAIAKEKPCAIVDGWTTRELMIRLSEDFVKFHGGSDVWAKLLYARLKGQVIFGELIIVPDMGFKEEVQYFESKLGIGSCSVAQLTRDGKNFDKDSRNYVRATGWTQIYHNSLGDLGVAESIAARLHSQLRNQLGWNI